MNPTPTTPPVPAPLQGPRVLLRFPSEADRAAYSHLRTSNRDHLERWEPLPLPPNGQSAFDTTEFDRLLATADTPDSKRLLITLGDSGDIAGRVSLGGIARGPLQQAYLGYWLGKEWEGRGLMQESITLALRYAFTPEVKGGLGLHRVECNVMPSNARSLATARRAGFREEGFSPRYLQIAGQWADHVRFAMTLEDFPRAAGSTVHGV